VPLIIVSHPPIWPQSSKYIPEEDILMLTYRLVRVIEYHSDALAASLSRKVLSCDRTESYRNVPSDELKQRVHEIYHHLGTWLIDKTAAEIGQRYMAIGTRRADQSVPVSELIWAIILTKHNLWDFIDDVTFPGRISDISDKQEILNMLDEFFDEAIHAAVVGYELTAEENAKLTHSGRKTG
jgi:hypothetical protein